MAQTAFRMLGPHRCYFPDSDHAEIARWLRMQAKTGMCTGANRQTVDYRNSCTCGINLPERDNSTSVILTRDCIPGEPTGWHISICCVTTNGYRGYQAAEGEHWADLLFGAYRGLLVELGPLSGVGRSKDVQHFRLDCDWRDRNNPVVTLADL